MWPRQNKSPAAARRWPVEHARSAASTAGNSRNSGPSSGAHIERFGDYGLIGIDRDSAPTVAPVEHSLTINSEVECRSMQAR